MLYAKIKQKFFSHISLCVISIPSFSVFESAIRRPFIEKQYNSKVPQEFGHHLDKFLLDSPYISR